MNVSHVREGLRRGTLHKVEIRTEQVELIPHKEFNFSFFIEFPSEVCEKPEFFSLPTAWLHFGSAHKKQESSQARNVAGF